MPHDLILTPHLNVQRASQLTWMAKHLDWQLDHPTDMPQPVAQSGVFEQLGSFLWEATHLEVDTECAALEAAQESERSLQFVVHGEYGQHLPWELLYHGASATTCGYYHSPYLYRGRCAGAPSDESPSAVVTPVVKR